MKFVGGPLDGDESTPYWTPEKYPERLFVRMGDKSESYGRFIYYLLGNETPLRHTWIALDRPWTDKPFIYERRGDEYVLVSA